MLQKIHDRCTEYSHCLRALLTRIPSYYCDERVGQHVMPSRSTIFDHAVMPALADTRSLKCCRRCD